MKLLKRFNSLFVAKFGRLPVVFSVNRLRGIEHQSEAIVLSRQDINTCMPTDNFLAEVALVAALLGL